jgi:hypothetical protein
MYPIPTPTPAFYLDPTAIAQASDNTILGIKLGWDEIGLGPTISILIVKLFRFAFQKFLDLINDL